jgi:hypothetical protein
MLSTSAQNCRHASRVGASSWFQTTSRTSTIALHRTGWWSAPNSIVNANLLVVSGAGNGNTSGNRTTGAIRSPCGSSPA